MTVLTRTYPHKPKKNKTDHMEYVWSELVIATLRPGVINQHKAKCFALFNHWCKNTVCGAVNTPLSALGRDLNSV